MSESVNTTSSKWKSSGISGNEQTILKMDLSEERPNCESPATRDRLTFSIDRILSPDFGQRINQRSTIAKQSCLDPSFWPEANAYLCNYLKCRFSKSNEYLSFFRCANSPPYPEEGKQLFVNVHSPPLPCTKEDYSPSSCLNPEIGFYSSSISGIVPNVSNNRVQSPLSPKDLKEYQAGSITPKADVFKLHRSLERFHSPEVVPENSKDISQYAIANLNDSILSLDKLQMKADEDDDKDFKQNSTNIFPPSPKKDTGKLMSTLENSIFSSPSPDANRRNEQKTYNSTFSTSQDNQDESSTKEEAKGTFERSGESQNKHQSSDRCSLNESRCLVSPDTKPSVKGIGSSHPQLKESEIINCENKSPSPNGSPSAAFPKSTSSSKGKSPLLEQLKPDVKSDMCLTGDDAWPVWVYCSRYSPRPSSVVI
ncbi:hypothetical protein NPIL_344711 [Nephila pilipes]|uniref:Uncharacterized protein n=1 Tax=Nephila pilipes TaxID=299642 RepID=A0A8X6Q6W4_NEPPI|nr:hypothetical protein NPIL_344711 [Nephila pilipes]